MRSEMTADATARAFIQVLQDEEFAAKVAEDPSFLVEEYDLRSVELDALQADAKALTSEVQGFTAEGFQVSPIIRSPEVDRTTTSSLKDALGGFGVASNHTQDRWLNPWWS